MKTNRIPLRLGASLLGFLSAWSMTTDVAAAESPGSRVKVQAPVANLHTQPSPLAPIIDVLARGDELTLIQREGEWYVGRLTDDRLGWVRQDVFRETPLEETTRSSDSPTEENAAFAEAAPPPQPPRLPDRARVASRSAQVRKKPADGSEIAFSLRRGEVVEVLEREGDWYRIANDSGKRGWAFVPLFTAAPAAASESPDQTPMPPSDDFVAETESVRDPEADAKRAVVEVRSGRVRSAPSLESPVATGIAQGEVVTITEQSGEWFAIETDRGETGWAHQKLFGPVAGGMLTDIRAESDEEADAETVAFELNGFHPPNTFALEEDNLLKIVCDFKDVLPAETLGRVIPLTGRYLKRVRLGVHKTPERKVRAVVDLSPNRQYGVEQIFFRESNRYVLKIRPLPPEESDVTIQTGTTG
ncbi:MAG: SH3 domain-containing protein [Desulfococcaceae bacterium]